MIADDTLRTFSRKYQTPELNVRREYVQHLFLSYFYQEPQAVHVYFKGGTALRIVYGSPRFSEDLDFDATVHDVREIEHAVLHSLVEIEREGIKSSITESKPTSGGYLAIIEFTLGTRVVPIRLEVSFRGKGATADTETIAGDFVPPYIINALAQEQLVDGKLAALLDRQKPRDFYDLYFMLQKGLITPKQKAVLREVLPLVQSTKINFAGELKTFLPQSHWAVIRDFKAVLERALGQYV